MFAPRKILVPTDFSSFSDEALKQAIDIAQKYQAEIRLLHVAPVVQHWPTGYTLNLDVPSIEEYEAANMALSEELIQEQIKRVGTDGVKIITQVKLGLPYEEILGECEGRGMDLIVIASHGRTGVVAHLIGSVALKVAQHAKCPVLLVRQ